MIRKIVGISICLIAIITQTGAQGLNIGVSGGLQGMQYQLPLGGRQLLPGGSLDLTYSFRLGDSWNLLSGVTGGLYRTQATLPDGVVYSSYEVDDGGSAFLYNVKAAGYKETQRFFAVGIPLLLQYHTTGSGIQWYINGGGKVLVPFSTSVQVSAKQLILSGYYPDYNIAVSNLPQHGFGTINGWNTSTTTNLKPTAALSGATGVSFSLSSRSRLYIGVYVEYGLTDLRGKNDSMPLMTYSPTGIAAVHAGSVLNRPNTGQESLLSFGVQLKLGFGSSSSRSKAAAAHNKGPQQPLDSATRVDIYEALERSIVFGLYKETNLPDIQKDHLDEVVYLMTQYPSIRLSLTGHVADNSQTQTESKSVGAERARAVAKYLRSKGISVRRIDINPTVERDEFVPDNPPANYRNRRVVVAVE